MSHGLKADPRTSVVWWGPQPTPAVSESFEARGLTLNVVAHTDAVPDAQLAVACGIVLSDDGNSPRFQVNLPAIAHRALCHGLQVVARAADAQAYARYEASIRDWAQTELPTRPKDALALQRRVTLTSAASDHDAAESIARHQSGPTANLELEGHAKAGLAAEDELLLRRAFRDCKTIVLQKLRGGTSGPVFCAHATLAPNLVGSWPNAFLVKFAARRMIEKEMQNYADRVSGFVPFLNRPNLASGRCLLGAQRGILVGTYVDRSEKFIDVARRGDAAVVINSLFDDALRGWREQSYLLDEHRQYADVKLQSIMEAIAKAFGCRAIGLERISKPRREMAAKLNMSRTPEAIVADLCALPPSRFRKGPVHGDLRAANVMAFRGTAILIDFYSARTAPLAWDPAALEASLLLDRACWPKIGADTPTFEQQCAGWDGVVLKLVQPDYLTAPPPPASRLQRLVWLWGAVRHVRMHALSSVSHPDEYRIALAIQLLRAAGHEGSSKDPGEQHRRAMALVLAEKVAGQIGKTP